MHIRPPIARISALLLASLILLALSASSALAALSWHPATGVSAVTTGADRIGNLMPGDELPVTTIAVHAQGLLRYALSSRISGSTSIASMLIVTIRTDSGDVLYEGPLADARVGDGSLGPSGGRVLRDTTEVLSISGHLSTDAGNEDQGAEVSVNWIVQATELASN